MTGASGVVRHDGGATFLAAAATALARHPAARAFYTMIANAPPERVDGAAAVRYFATAGNPVAGLAAQTAPDRQLIIEGSDAVATPALARDFAATGRPLTGLMGEAAVCAAFLAEWQRYQAARYVLDARLRHHRLTQVNAVPAAHGGMRVALADDADWLVQQQRAFAAEVRLPDPPARIDAQVRLRLAQGRFRIWTDGEPVAYAGCSDGGEAGARIGPVWTTPAARGRGYATALVAALSRELLAAGKRELFLVTDVANPTSNAIYARIGFEPLQDSCLYLRHDPA